MRHDPAPPRPPARGGAAGILLAAILMSAITGAVAGGAAVSYLAPAPAVVTAGASPAPAPAATVAPVRNAGGEPVVDLVRDVLPGVVTVINKLPGGQPQASGSGYVIDAQRGYIVTNSHVVTNVRNNNAGDAFDVIFSDETKVAAKPSAATCRPMSRCPGPRPGAAGAPLGNSDEVPVGAGRRDRSALGEPRNSTRPASSRRRGAGRSPRCGGHPPEDLIQTDAAISPNRRTAHLVATRQVVGMNTPNREPGAEDPASRSRRTR